MTGTEVLYSAELKDKEFEDLLVEVVATWRYTKT